MKPEDQAKQPELWRRVLNIVIGGCLIALFSGATPIPNSVLIMVLVGAGVFWFWRATSPAARVSAIAESVAAGLQGERISRSVWLEIRQAGSHGDLSGAVLDGPFAGRVLSSLSDPELLELLAQLDHSDRFSAKALRAWLAHARPHLDVQTLDEMANGDNALMPEEEASLAARIDQREKDLPPVPQPASIARQKFDRVAEPPAPPRSLEGMTEAEAFALLGILDTKDVARISNAYDRAVKMAGGEKEGGRETLARLALARRVLLGA